MVLTQQKTRKEITFTHGTIGCILDLSDALQMPHIVINHQRYLENTIPYMSTTELLQNVEWTMSVDGLINSAILIEG